MRKIIFLAAITVPLVFLNNDVCYAGIFEDVNQNFQNTASAWKNIVIGYATKLFWILAPISFVITTGEAWLKGQISDATSFFAHFMRTCLFLGFFLWLLQNGPDFAKTIIVSMEQIGKEAVHFNADGPSVLLSNTFDLLIKITKMPIDGLSSLGSYLGAIIIGIIFLVIMTVISMSITIEYCAAWVVLYTGCFLLGFGSTSWTSDMAITYFKTVFATAIRLMTMLMLIGITANIITPIITSAKDFNAENLISLLTYAIIFLALMNKIPNMIAGMVGGGQSAGNLGVGSMMAAASLAGAGISAAGAAASLAGAGISAGAGLAGSAISMGGSALGMGGGGASPVKEAIEKAEAAFEELGGGGLPGFSGGSSGGSGGDSISPAFDFGPTQFATPVSGLASGSFSSSELATPTSDSASSSQLSFSPSGDSASQGGGSAQPSLSQHSDPVRADFEGSTPQGGASAQSDLPQDSELAQFASPVSDSASLGSFPSSDLSQSSELSESAAPANDKAQKTPSGRKGAGDYLAQAARDLANDLEK